MVILPFLLDAGSTSYAPDATSLPCADVVVDDVSGNGGGVAIGYDTTSAHDTDDDVNFYL